MEVKSEQKDGRTYGVRYGVLVPLDKFEVGLDKVDNTNDAEKPISNAASAALAGKEPVIAVGLPGQYWRGDKTWQALNKSTIGLGKVDNTADIDKRVSAALVARQIQDSVTGAFIVFSFTEAVGQPVYLWGGNKDDGRIYDRLNLKVGEANNADNANAIGGIESADLFSQLKEIFVRLKTLEDK